MAAWRYEIFLLVLKDISRPVTYLTFILVNFYIIFSRHRLIMFKKSLRARWRNEPKVNRGLYAVPLLFHLWSFHWATHS